MLDKEEEKLTRQQQKALHLFFTLLANELNEMGLDQRKVLKPSIEIPWSGESVKEQIWRPIQEALYIKKSTTKLLKKEEIDKIYDIIVKHLGEKFGFSVPSFPCIEEILNQQRDD